MPIQSGFSLRKPLVALLGLAAILLVMIAPQAASRPLGCEMPRRVAMECVDAKCPSLASNYCKPYLA